MNKDIEAYNNQLEASDKAICDLLANEIDKALAEAESKIWHRHPVWFLDGNPVVGYNKLKNSIRLLFWSGQSFEEDGLAAIGNFKAAGADYRSVNEIDTTTLSRWLSKCRDIQWDYKIMVKRKGQLERLK